MSEVRIVGRRPVDARVGKSAIPVPAGPLTVRRGAAGSLLWEVPISGHAAAVDQKDWGMADLIHASPVALGRLEPVDPRAGHIPGARSVPARGNVDETGRFLPLDELRRRFRAAGVTDEAAVVSYCAADTGDRRLLSTRILMLSLLGGATCPNYFVRLRAD